MFAVAVAVPVFQLYAVLADEVARLVAVFWELLHNEFVVFAVSVAVLVFLYTVLIDEVVLLVLDDISAKFSVLQNVQSVAF